MCVTCLAPVRARNTRNARLSLSGPALQSPVSGAGAGLSTEFLRCVSVSEVSPALWSSVTIRLQWREHIRHQCSHHQRTHGPTQLWWQYPAFVSNKRKCCSIYPRGKCLIGIDVKGSSYHALAGKSYSFRSFYVETICDFFLTWHSQSEWMSVSQMPAQSPSWDVQLVNFCIWTKLDSFVGCACVILVKRLLNWVLQSFLSSGHVQNLMLLLSSLKTSSKLD